MSFPLALASLLDQHEVLLDPLVGRDHKEFVSRVLANEKSLSHPEHLPWGDDGTQTIERYKLVQILRFLLRISILHSAGFPRDWIERILQRNQQYVHLKDASASEVL